MYDSGLGLWAFTSGSLESTFAEMGEPLPFRHLVLSMVHAGSFSPPPPGIIGVSGCVRYESSSTSRSSSLGWKLMFTSDNKLQMSPSLGIMDESHKCPCQVWQGEYGQAKPCFFCFDPAFMCPSRHRRNAGLSLVSMFLRV